MGMGAQQRLNPQRKAVQSAPSFPAAKKRSATAGPKWERRRGNSGAEGGEEGARFMGMRERDWRSEERGMDWDSGTERLAKADLRKLSDPVEAARDSCSCCSAGGRRSVEEDDPISQLSR